MDDELKIRPIEAAHVGDLIHIGEATKLSPWSAESYLDELKNPNAVMLRLVADGNQTIGFVVGRFVPGEGESVDAEIYNIAIKEAEQRCGRGQILFDAFAAECSERHVSNIWLEVRESNDKAISFYERNGFERVQTRKAFYADPPEHALLMRLELTKNAP